MEDNGLSRFIPSQVHEAHRPLLSCGWEMAALSYMVAVWLGVIGSLVLGFSISFHAGVAGLFLGSSLLYIGAPLSVVALTLVARLHGPHATRLGRELLDAALTLFFLLGASWSLSGLSGFSKLSPTMALDLLLMTFYCIWPISPLGSWPSSGPWGKLPPSKARPSPTWVLRRRRPNHSWLPMSGRRPRHRRSSRHHRRRPRRLRPCRLRPSRPHHRRRPPAHPADKCTCQGKGAAESGRGSRLTAHQ